MLSVFPGESVANEWWVYGTSMAADWLSAIPVWLQICYPKIIFRLSSINESVTSPSLVLPCNVCNLQIIQYNCQHTYTHNMTLMLRSRLHTPFLPIRPYRSTPVSLMSPCCCHLYLQSTFLRSFPLPPLHVPTTLSILHCICFPRDPVYLCTLMFFLPSS